MTYTLTSNVNREEWNGGICPRCKKGIWKKDGEIYRCSNCRNELVEF